jgi:hypothetical protein
MHRLEDGFATRLKQRLHDAGSTSFVAPFTPGGDRFVTNSRGLRRALYGDLTGFARSRSIILVVSGLQAAINAARAVWRQRAEIITQQQCIQA